MNKMKYIFALSGWLLTISSVNSRPDGHAPIGVMGDHIHREGEIMFSYRAMMMNMSGLGESSSEVSSSEVLSEGYMSAPTSMAMTMHMAGMMVAPADWVTLMAMVGYTSNSMDMDMSAMMTMDNPMKSSGIHDLKIGGLFSCLNSESRYLLCGLSLSVPIGSIDEKVSMTMMNNSMEKTMPFAMQPGSGSYELSPSLTYAGYHQSFSYGAQAKLTLPLQENKNGWKYGPSGLFSMWASWVLNEIISTSLRATYRHRENVSGSDPDMLTGSPSGLPELQKKTSVALDFGVNVMLPADGLRFAAEAGLPVYQNVAGPQMLNAWHAVAGIQYAFQAW